MAVERPERDGVGVNADTMGGAAAGLRSLRGLTDWRGNENTGLAFGDGAVFRPATGLGDVQEKAMKVAWGVVGRIERLNTHYADAVARAARTYGAADRHSADAVDAAAKGMAAPPRGTN